MIKNKNSISIVVPSIKPETWLEFIDNHQSKNVDIEIIFIGPKKNNFKLPKNVKFIQTHFKVTQCLAIGLKYASKYYLLQTADDQVLMGSDDPIGDLVKEANLNSDKIVSIGNAYNGKKLTSNELCLISNNPKTYIPFSMILPKETIIAVGGYNANYIASYSDVDLYLRVKNSINKNEYFYKKIYMNENRPADNTLGLLSFRYLGHDIKYLKYNWVNYDKISNDYYLRKKSLEDSLPFNQDNILIEEQGTGTSKIFKSKYYIYLMKFKFFRYFILIFYKIFRKYIIRAKYY